MTVAMTRAVMEVMNLTISLFPPTRNACETSLPRAERPPRRVRAKALGHASGPVHVLFVDMAIGVDDPVGESHDCLLVAVWFGCRHS